MNIVLVSQSDYAISKAEFEWQLASGKYDIEISYLSPSGAYWKSQKGMTPCSKADFPLWPKYG